ncbi:hypothetical protein [Corynebacterium comes]|uniref:Gram-positive cocci surface proteins LPxTG domain-containing protein n=1 Tax=Corynebacterium comes TaxID=2675218 RepID=A0A6B8WA53_9CORY|nr:hypothetical protein [Corynebacterium comes]QGU03798.1 hypothetical protein CETAM_02590 [Corynebacterium comes]
MFNKRIAAAVAGASLASLTFLAPPASADQILEIGDKCFVEEVVTHEEVVGTRTVAEPVARQGDWPIGEVEGPAGWTFHHTDTTEGPGQGAGTIVADIPAGTPAGEYTAVAYHFGYSKNQVSEPVTYTVVEEDITESRTWNDREEVPCEDDIHDDTASGDGSHSGDSGASGASDQQADFVDYKVLAQQQAMNAPATAPAAVPAAAAPATEEVTPTQAAQQMQLANNGLGGTLIALAVGLAAAAAGAGLVLKRRAN